MPDHLKELQNVVKQIQQEPPRRRVLDWLRVVAGLSRLATVVGVLIVLGVVGSAIWPYTDKIQELLRPKPAALPTATVAPAPQVVPSPALLPKTPERPKPNQKPSQTTDSPAQAAVEAPPSHKVGDIFEVAAWEYCVRAAEWRESLKVAGKTVWPEPGRKFLEVALTICNTGEETAIVPPPRLVGLDGKPVEATLKAGVDASIAGESLSPDRHYKRQVVFEVPRGKGYKVLLQGGWLSEKKAVVEVGQ